MIYNIENVESKIRLAISEFPQFSFGKDGVELYCAESMHNSVSFENDRVTIRYTNVARLAYSLFLFDSVGYTGETENEFEHLEVMLDVSRNAVRTVNAVKKLMRYLVLMGYTGIQLYMEDVYEIPEEPYFGYKRGRYSEAELKEIVKYGRLLGLEVVPAIQTLAHLNCITRWRRFKPIIDFGDILLAEEDETYQFIENMFKSLQKYFGCEKINIGMDEAHMVGLGKYLDKHGYTDRSAIVLRHLQKVCEIAQKYGFREPMIWNDMFIRLANKGDLNGEKEVSKEILELVPKNVTLIGWNYYKFDVAFYEKQLKMQQKFNRPVYFAGGVNSWHGVTPQNKFAIKQTTAALKGCKKVGVKNFIATVWGDDGAECSPFACLPSLAFGGYFANGRKDYKRLFEKLTGIPFDKFILLDLPNDVCETFDPLVQPSKYMLYNDCLQGLCDCTVKKGDGDKYKSFSLRLSRLVKNEEWGYLFQTQATLSRLLYVKYELGVKTREAYLSGDKESLERLVKTDYKSLIKYVDEFYKALKTQWFKECKAFGFEIQDYRLGGLKQRILHCMQILQDYLNGNTEAIEELDEEVLNVLCNDGSNGQGIDFRSFKQIISAGVLSAVGD